VGPGESINGRSFLRGVPCIAYSFNIRGCIVTMFYGMGGRESVQETSFVIPSKKGGGVPWPHTFLTRRYSLLLISSSSSFFGSPLRSMSSPPKET